MTVTPIPLGEVATFIRGITFKPEDKVEIDSPDAVVCMRTKNVQDIIDQDDLIAVPPSFVNRQEQYLIEGDILVSTANSWELVGKSCWVPKIDYKATAGGFISILRSDRKKVFPRYLYHWMNSSETLRNLRYCGRQTTNISNMSFELACALKLPLPPLPEQKRIAAILDKADSIRRKRQEAVRLTEELLQSAFLEMFGDPVTNPKGWPFQNLGDVCDVRDGTHDSPKYVSEGGFPLVTSKNLTGGTVDLTDVNFISETDYAQINKRSRVDRGDIIMPMIGTIGSPVFVDHCPNFAIKNVALIKFTEQSPSAVFVLHLLSSRYFDHIIGQKSRGGTQQFVSLGDLRSFPLPLPPSELQTEFARRISAVEKLRNSHLRSMSELDALFNALLQRAFKGELY